MFPSKNYNTCKNILNNSLNENVLNRCNTFCNTESCMLSLAWNGCFISKQSKFRADLQKNKIKVPEMDL